MSKRLALLMAVLISLGLGVWAFYLEPASLRLTSHAIQLKRWPQNCQLKIAVLADLHVGSPYNGLDRLQKVVAVTQQARADLILIPGDLISHQPLGEHIDPEPIAAVLSQLTAPLGVYAVLGNHDWWFDAPRVQQALEQAGIAVLEDQSTVLNSSQCPIHLVGISDYWEGAHDIRQAFGSIPAGAHTLAFTHNPDIFPELPSTAHMTIAGHTHGGQVYIPGLGRLVVPSDFGERYAIGHIQEGGRHLYVTPGIGTSILPVRFLVPPEITVLTISASTQP